MSIRVASIVSEALRNVATRTSRPVLSVVVFVVVIGGLSLYDIGAINGILHQSRDFAASGATITTINLSGKIDGSACESLATAPNIRAAGALASTPDTTFSALPSTPVPTKLASPGFVNLLPHRANTTRSGLYLSRDLASALGASAGDTVNTSRGDSYVEGVYDYPDDGRLPGLGYAVISPVAPEPSVKFDSCWIDSPHPADDTSSLLWTTITQSGPDANPTMGQLNTTRGLTFDAKQRFQDRPSALFATVAAPLGVIIGYTSKRLRRLEIASALHCRVPRLALLLQALVEEVVWLVPALGLVLTGCVYLAGAELPQDTAAVTAAGARIAVVAALGILVGAATAVLTTRERHLFRYFKER